MPTSKDEAIKLLTAYIRASYPLPCGFEDCERATSMRATLHEWCKIAENCCNGGPQWGHAWDCKR
jgi:hypothetical protein